MRRALHNRRWTFRASAATAVLAFFCVGGGVAAAQEELPEDRGLEPVAVGGVTISGEQQELGEELLVVVGRVLAWLEPEPRDAWGGLVAALSSVQEAGDALAWRLLVSDGAGLWPEERGEVPPLGTVGVAGVAFDVSLDCNTFRAASPQPLSRSVRGRVLDALTIDNARRARLAGVYADSEDFGELTVVLFTESRAEAPGRWRARPIARVQRATNRGDPAPPHPLEIGFGALWEGVLFAAADLALGLDPESETLSTAERLTAWGPRRVGAVRALGAGLDGRAWVWPGVVSAESVVVCLPLSRGVTAREVAGHLRTIFGQRLVWGRDATGRARGTLALVRENRAAAEGDRMVSLRFITIAERTVLAVATEADELDEAVETLADIPQ